jgi:hypothetical protein
VKRIIFASFLVGLSLISWGETYHPGTTAIVWDAQQTNVPVGLWVYKVLPQTFSAAILSNLMEYGSFTSKNLAKATVEVPDKDLIHFQVTKSNVTRYLNIAPAIGWIEYYDAGAQAPFGHEEGVPSESEAINLARDFLFRLGIDRALVVQKPTAMSVGRQGNVPTATSKGTEVVYSRGVFLSRRVDGFNIVGNGMLGGLVIEFGNHSKAMNFNLLWRNLMPFRRCRVATPTELVGWIKQGKSAYTEPHEDVRKANRATVKRLSIFYEGADESQRQEYVRPFAELELETDLADKAAHFVLHCPIIVEEESR